MKFIIDMSAIKCLMLILVILLTSQCIYTLEEKPESNFLAVTTDECLRLIDRGDYGKAKSGAVKLIESMKWKSGDLETAGAIRAIVDAFRASGKTDYASEILVLANKTHKPAGDAAIALRGFCLPENSRLTLPVLNRIVIDKTFINAAFNPSVDLKRIRVGNQASVLKIMDPSNKTVVFMRGLDGVLWAPVQESHRQNIFAALGISQASLDGVVSQLINVYQGTPQKKECIALLGIIGSSGGSSLTAETRRNLQSFLVRTMKNSANVIMRRQACLSLALSDSILPTSVEEVISFYEKSRNLWETFPVQQVFEYQKQCINQMPSKVLFRARIAAVKALYTPNILKFL